MTALRQPCGRCSLGWCRASLIGVILSDDQRPIAESSCTRISRASLLYEFFQLIDFQWRGYLMDHGVAVRAYGNEVGDWINLTLTTQGCHRH